MTTEFRVSGRDGKAGAVEDVEVVVEAGSVMAEDVGLLAGDVDKAVPRTELVRC